jgi:hypothetical protein
MTNITIVLKERLRARIKFALTAIWWSSLALGIIVLITAYTIRLDIAFMEANHMLKNEGLRDAIFVQVFDLEPWVYFAYPFGILANGVIAALFAGAQDRYFRRFREAFENFGKSWMRPDLKDLGPLSKCTWDFMVLVQGSFVDGKSKPYLDVRTKMLNEWPKAAQVYWRDQIRYALLSGVLACYFSALSMIVFWQANDKILNLSRSLTRSTGGDAPQFFATQMEMSGNLGWAVVGLITLASVWSGLKYAWTTSNAAYACGRQLRNFLEGDAKARIQLRHGDPGRDDMPAVNEVLAKLEEAMKAAKP